MAFFNWSRKKEEVEQPKQVEKNDVPKVVDYFNIKETEFGFARLVNIRRYRGYTDRDRYINSGIRVRNPYTDWNLQ
jgi:hypothetical protein